MICESRKACDESLITKWNSGYGLRYSRMYQVKFVEDSL